MDKNFQFSAQRDDDGLVALNGEVERTLEELDLSPKLVFAVQLVVDELASNIVKYGSGAPAGSEISLRLQFESEWVTIEIESAGDCFNPFERAEPELDQPVADRAVGGLGIHLARNVMDDCRHSYRDGRNLMVLRKKFGLDGSK